MFVCDWDFLHFGLGILVGVALVSAIIIGLAIKESWEGKGGGQNI